MELKLLFVLAFVAGIQAGPIDTVRDSCSRTCSSTNKFGYRPGKSYEFDYNVKTSTSVKGASEGLSGLELTAKVHIEAVTKCDFILRIENVQLHEADPTSVGSRILSAGSEELRQVLERHDLRFSFQDGVVEELCPSSDEITWVLNIKRGILSVFQNSMDDFRRNQKTTESDVNGNCAVEYSTADNTQGYTIRKSKNLLGCTDRNEYRTSIQGIPYKVPSGIQGLPFLTSDHQCQQEITSDGLLVSANCMETHLFKPFSREGKGAVTESKQTLEFVQESIPASTPGAIGDRRGMVFEHSYGADQVMRSRVEVENKLMAICANTQQDIRPETPQLFSELVYLMKSVSAQSLRAIYHKVRSGTLCSNNIKRMRKFFLDAIPMTGSSASLSMLTELINDEEVTGVEADMWLTTLSFIQHPTKDMLREVLPLVSRNNGKAMLAVSSLVHNYCRQKSCEDDIDVNNIVSTIERKIEYGCYVDGDKLEKTILSLRAIGNSGHAVSSISTINSCLSKQDNPTEVRLAAAEAFRRMPCDADRTELSTVFSNKAEDSEVRIAAYLALMQCANVQTINLVKRQLETEEVNQVGSFVWSHLSNLKESSNIYKQDIRAILNDEELRKGFDLDNRKFSHNYEKSFFLEKLNTGATVESNLIWSPSSFLPRSAMANLTVDLFGHSVNIFEVGGRIEGLEYFMESYFGPNGYFSDNEATDKAEQSVKGISTRKMKNIDRQFGRGMDELKGALYTRVFGNELSYIRLDGNKPLFGEDFNILEMLISLSKNHDYTLTQNFMFMDSSMIIPTATGLPLNLTVNGTATIDMKASGRMDFRKIATSPRSVSIDGSLQPSAALEVSSMMSVDAFVTKSGLKMVSTLHTSTVARGKIELADGRVLELQLDMPRDKMEIFNFKTAFFTVHKDLHREQEMITENRQSHRICTGNGLTKVTGVQLCGEIQFPNASLKADAPYFPLTGPVTMGVELNKMDTFNSYKFETKFVRTRRSTAAKIAFNTPGSTVDRHLEIDFLLNQADNTLTMDLVSPWKKASLSGSLQNERALKQFQGRFVLDTNQEYAVTAEVQQSRKGAAYVYTPSIEVRIPGKDLITLGGSVEYMPLKTIDADFALVGMTPQPVKSRVTIQNKKMMKSFRGTLSFEEGKEYSTEVRLQTTITKIAAKYRPFLYVRTPEKELIIFDGSADYRAGKAVSVDLTLSKVVPKDIKITAWIKNKQEKNNQRYQSKVDIRSPFITTKMQSNVVLKAKKALVTHVKLDYNVPRLIRDKITINGKANLATTKSTENVKGSIKVDFKRRPQFNIDTSLDATHTKRSSNLVFSMIYGADKEDQNKRITLSTTVGHKQTSWPESTVSVDFDLKHLGQGIDVGFEGRHSHDQKQIDTSLTIQPRRSNELAMNLRLKNKSKITKSLSGSLALSYGGENIQVGNDLDEATDGEYTNTMTAQWANSEKSTIVTTFRLPSARHLIGSVDINLADMTRVRVAGEYMFERTNVSVKTEVRLAGDKYAWTSLYQLADRAVTVTTAIEYPSRHITFDADATYHSPLYTIRTNLLWDTEDTTKRLHLDGRATVESINSIDASLNQESPLGTFTVNMKHRGGSKFISHADVEWDRSKRITVDTTFSNRGSNENRNIVGTLQFTSPFRGYRSIATEAILTSDSDQYSTTLDVNWKPIKKISTSISLKKPISLTNIEGEVSIKSPLKGFQRTAFGISHKITDKISSMAKFTWNKNIVQFNVDAANKGSESTRDISGRISLKTSIPEIGSMYVAGRHTDDGRRFENNLSMKKNGKGLTYEGEMNHNRNGWQIHNTGRFSLTILSKRIQSTWNHENTQSNIRTNLNSNWGRHNLEFDLNAVQALEIEQGTASASMVLAGNVLPSMQMSATHEHAFGIINNVLTIQHDTNTVISIKNKYGRANGIANSVHTLQVWDNIYTAKVESHYDRYPYTGAVDVQWAPSKQIIFSASVDNDNGLYSGRVDLQSPGIHDVILSFHQNRESAELINLGSVQYGSAEVASIENRFRWDNTKRIFIVVTSQLENFRNLETNIEFTGDVNTFHTAAHFELQPFVSRISASSQWGLQRDIVGNVRINTPFAALPYSQVTVTSKDESGKRVSTLIIEYLPNRVLKLENSYKILPGDLSGSITLSTPFSKLPRVSALGYFQGNWRSFQMNFALENTHSEKYEVTCNFSHEPTLAGKFVIKAPRINDIRVIFNHQGDSNQFTSHGQFTWINGNFYQIDADFTRIGKWEGKVVLRIPDTDDITATIHHSGNTQRFRSNVGVKHGQQTSKLNIVFINDGNLEGSLVFRSPFTDDMNAVFQHNGNLEHFQSHGEVQYGRVKQLEMDATFSSTDNTEGTLKIKSPLTDVISVAFHKNGRWNNFQSHGEIQYQISKKIEIDTALNLINKIEGSARLQTPYTEDISAALHHTGNLEQFQSHAELEYHPTKKFEGDLSFINGERIEGTLALKSPFTEDTSAAVQFEKQRASFNTHGEAQYGSDKVQADVSLAWGNRKSGSFAMKSPFTNNVHAAFDHDGNWNQFSSHAELSLNPEEKKYEADISFANARKLKASVSVKCKHFNDVDVAILQRGRRTNFNNRISVQYGDQRVDSDLTFRMNPSLTASIVINTPFNGFRKLQGNFKHDGSWESFNIKTTAAIGKSKIIASSSFTLNPLDIDINIQTPFAGYKELRTTFSHSGTLSSFQTHGSVLYGKKKSIVSDLQFNVEPVTGTLKIITPFSGYESLKAKISHEGNMTKSQSILDVALPRKRKLLLTANIDLTSTLSGDVTIITPFKGYEKLNAAVSHTGTISNFECHAEAGVGTKKITGDIRFNMLDRVTGEVTVVTPFRGYRNTRLVFSKDGTLSDFRCHAEALLTKQKHEADLTFSALDNISSSFTINSPYVKPVKATIFHSGNRQRFTSRANFGYGESEVAFGQIKFNSSPSIKGVVVVRSMWTEPLTASVGHGGNLQNFRTNADISYGNFNIVMDTTLDTRRDITGSFNFRSPFYPVEDLTASISHSGSISNGQSQFEGIYKGEKIEAILIVDSEAKKELSIDITTPFTEFNHMKAALSHTYTRDMLTGHLELELNEQKVEAETVLNMMNGITGKFVVKSPWYNDVVAEFSHTGSLSAFQIHAELAYSGARQLQGDVSFESLPQTILTCTVVTPWEQVRNMGAMVRFQGTLSHFTSFLELTLKDQRITGDVNFNSINGIDVRGTFRTPFTRELVVSMTQSGTLMNMQSHAELVYGRAKQMELDGSWDLTSAIETTVSLKTPLEGFTNLLFKFSHVGGYNGFRSEVTAIYYMKKKIEASAQFTNADSLEGSITISSPFSAPVGVSFTKTDEIATGEVHYDNNEVLFTKATYQKMPDTVGTFLLRSVIPAFKNLSGGFSHQGSLQNMNSHVDISINGQMAQADLTFKNGFKKQGSLRIRSPIPSYEDIGVSFSHKFGRYILESAVQGNIGDQQSSGKVSLKWRNNIDGSFQIATPFRNYRNIRGTLTHSGNLQQFTCHVDFQYAPSHQITADVNFSSVTLLEGSVLMTSPFVGYERVSAAFRHDLSPEAIESHIELIYPPSKKIEMDINGSFLNDVHGRISLKTPFVGYEETAIALRMTSLSEGFGGEFEAECSQGRKLEIEISLAPSEGHVNIKSPFAGYEEMSAAFVNKITTENLSGHAEVTYLQRKLETDVFLSSSTGHLTVKTPFSGFEEMSSSYTNQGTLDDFVSHAEISYMSDQKFVIDVTFSAGHGSITLRTPFVGYEHMSGSFTKDITENTISGTAEITYAPEKHIEIDATLSMPAGHVTIKTPFAGYETISAAFTNQMTSNSIANHLEVTYLPGQKIELDVSVSSEEGRISVTSPFTGYEEISAGFTNRISDNSIEIKLEVTYLPTKKLEIDISFTPETGHVILKTPFSGYEEISAEFKNQMTNRSFASQAIINYLPGRRIELDFLVSPEEGHVVLKTPFDGYEEMSAAFTNQMTDASISNHIEVTYQPGHKLESDISLMPQEGRVTLKTPFIGFEELSAAYRQEITDEHLVGSLEVSYKPGKTLEINLSFSSMAGHVTIRTPFSGYEIFEVDVSFSLREGHLTLQTPVTGYETFSATYTLNMQNSNYDFHTQLIDPKNRKIQVDVTVANTNHKVVTVNVKTPFAGYEEFTFTTSHTMRNGRLRSLVSLDYGEKIEASVISTFLSGVDASLTLKTPFDGYRLSKLNFVFSNDVRGIRNQAVIVFMEERAEYDLSINYNPSIEFSFVMKTPITGYEMTSATFRHVKSVENQQIHSQLLYGVQKNIQLEMTLQTTSGLVGSMTLNTPFSGFESIIASVEMNLSDTAMTSNIVFAVGERTIKNNINIEMSENSINGVITLQTPFKDFENMGGKLTAAVAWDNSQIDTSVIYGQMKPLELTMKHSISTDRYEASFNFRTTYTPAVTTSIIHLGDWMSFSNTIQMTAGTENSIEHNLVSRFDDNLADLSSTFTGQIAGQRQSMKTTFKHEGPVNNFRTNFVNNYNGRRSIMEILFRNTASIEGSFMLKTPFKSFRNIAASLTHSGYIDQFSTVGNVRLSPSKQITTKIDFFNHRLRRINANFEFTTPFEGFELTKLRYRHTVTSNDVKCFSDIMHGSKKLSGSLKASKIPLAFDLSLQTPFTDYEDLAARAKYARQGLSHNANMYIKYCTGKEVDFKTAIDLASNPITFTADLTTPFAGYESTDLRYTHVGSFPNFRCTAEFSSSYLPAVNGELSVRFESYTNMQVLTTLTSTSFETLRFVLRNQKDQTEYQSHSEVGWSQNQVIVVDGSLSKSESWNGNSGNLGITVTTPFTVIRSMAVTARHELVSSKYTETVSAEWNGDKMLDMDVQFGKDTTYLTAITMRKPWLRSFSGNLELSESVIRGDLDLHLNTDNNIRMEASLNDGSDRFTNRKDFSAAIALPTKSIGVTGTFSKSPIALSFGGNLMLDSVATFGIDYQTSSKVRGNNNEFGKQFVIRLPSRTFKATSHSSNRYGTKTTEGSIFWDADNDENKRIEMRGRVIPQGPSTKVDFSVSLPSIGKDIKFDSEVTLNSGNVIFDGKTEFSYSGDPRNQLVIHSRVEDLSSGFRKNYSFVVGVSHPATTIDVQLSSHLGHADNKYSAGMDLQYLTAKQNRKNFALMGEIDNVRKQIDVQMVSPVKSMKLSAQARTNVPYRLSIRNLYDERPIEAQMTIDPSKLTMDMQMSYDIENPRKILHVEAKYVNSSAIKTEVYREENTQRITDTLFAMRLNTSRILHTRLHWRPSIIQDLKRYGLDMMLRNNRDLIELYNEITSAMNEELNSKYNNIRRYGLLELKPFVQMATSNMRGMQQDLTTLRTTLREHLSDCQYLRDIYSRCDRMLDTVSRYYTTVVEESDDFARWLETAASQTVTYPNKANVDMYIVDGRVLLQTSQDRTMEHYSEMMDGIDVKLGELSSAVLQSFKTYHDYLTNAIAQSMDMEAVKLVKAKYNEYLTHLTDKIPHITSFAKKYTSALSARTETINTRLNGILNTPEIALIRSKAAAAYKYWEIEENMKAAMRSVYDYIIEMIDEEIELLKSTITDLEKTKITVFDPVNGEIQTDTYLIVPMKSLKSLPRLDIDQYYNKLKLYLPDTSKWGSVCDYIPSSDVSNWIPPFDVFGTVDGNMFTTFDGKTYPFSGRCSYVLAGDYVDGNFSIVLDYMGKQKRKLVITTPQHTVQLLPKSKLRVDGTVVEMPYNTEDVSVANSGDEITVTGRGFSVMHNSVTDKYKVGLSGWYFGKTGGLLGTYDNERYNDIMTPSRQITRDISSFADAWEVNAKCR